MKFCSNNMKGAGLCCLSTPGRLLNKILQKKKKSLCLTTLTPQHISVSQWWAVPAGKSFRKPWVHFHSSFQQCECCDSLLGQRDYWDQASPSSTPLAQPATPSQSAPGAPQCLTEQPTRHTESKEAPGTTLIVHALGGSLANQHEEGAPGPKPVHSPGSESLRTIYIYPLWGSAVL